jgi:uncharacterized protein YukE
VALTNLPVEDIEQLAATVKSQADQVLQKLDELRAAVQRDPNFTGSAADRYDEYLSKWDVHQKALAENLDGAGTILSSYAARLRENTDLVDFTI